MKLVSIIIPAYNAILYILATVDSALNQTYQHVEILIIDDGSTDGTVQAVLDHVGDDKRVRILHHEGKKNRGVSASRKLGIEHSRGEYIALLDADDLFEIDKLEKQITLLESNPNSVLCHSAANCIYNGMTKEEYANDFSLGFDIITYDLLKCDYVLSNNRICTSSTVVRAKSLKEVCFEAPQLFQFEDWVQWILLGSKGKFVFTPEQLVRYRVHPTSATAAVLRNDLVPCYSYIEMLLTLLAKLGPEQKQILKQIPKIISEQLDILTQLYSGQENSNKTWSSRVAFHSSSFCKNQQRKRWTRLKKRCHRLLHKLKKCVVLEKSNK